MGFLGAGFLGFVRELPLRGFAGEGVGESAFLRKDGDLKEIGMQGGRSRKASHAAMGNGNRATPDSAAG